MHFFAKKFGHVKKKQYLCTRFRSNELHWWCSAGQKNRQIVNAFASIAQLVEH